jgi:outer membrane protein OmpA-like peptidoglycan-associated protein
MKLNSILILLISCLFQITNAISQEMIEVKRLDSIPVFFKSGSDKVEDTEELIARLNLVKAPMGKVRIISYTDTIGSLSSNQKLAAKRLSAVSKIVRLTNLKTFLFDSINKNELRSGRKLRDSSCRRVDVIIYIVENKFKFNEPINLDINFKPKTDIIIPNSTENLKTLLSILQKDSTVRVQLNGHVCCNPHYELSLQRAERVKKYLVSNGIKSTRISCKGFSNTVPLVSSRGTVNLQKNMRVEVVFLK